MYSISLASPWMEPGKLGPTRGHAAVVTCRPFPGRGVTKRLVGMKVIPEDDEGYTSKEA